VTFTFCGADADADIELRGHHSIVWLALKRYVLLDTSGEIYHNEYMLTLETSLYVGKSD